MNLTLIKPGKGIGVEKEQIIAIRPRRSVIHLYRPAWRTLADLVCQWSCQIYGFVFAATVDNDDFTVGEL